ncbi:hypothetical protein D3Z50_12050 [Clostridiaceae bacterium]|nr:hypothetical protein [Clostridiaceae bacterium]
MTSKKTYSARELASDAILSVLLLITGMFKIPSFLPGAEFQISAPFAVAIAKNFGFKRYLMIGIASSFCGFALGVQNLLNIAVAMIYRIVAGAILALYKDSKFAVIISGPCGTLLSRIILAQLTGADMRLLILYALPGMVFTAVTAPVFVKAAASLVTVQPEG